MHTWKIGDYLTGNQNESYPIFTSIIYRIVDIDETHFSYKICGAINSIIKDTKSIKRRPKELLKYCTLFNAEAYPEYLI